MIQHDHVSVAWTFGLLVHWALVIGGIIYVISRSTIGGPVRKTIGLLLKPWPLFRDWARGLIYCTACTGFWVSLAAVDLWPFDGPLWAKMLGAGFAGVALGTLWGATPMWAAAGIVYEYEAPFWGVEESDAEQEEEEQEQDE